MKPISFALAALLLAAPGGAQQWQVARESFAFAGSQLEIQVDVEAPGTLRVIRGAPGAVRVAGRAATGFTGAGLGDERLTLSAAGPGPVDYLVSVPADVWVDIRLPGSGRGVSMAGRDRSRTFQWERSAHPHEPVAGWLPPLDDRRPRFTSYARDYAPAVVSFPELDNVRSVGIRIEGSRFRVTAGRPLSVDEGSPEHLEIRPAGPPMDLVVTLPAHTDQFRLQLGGQTALLIDGPDVDALCAPVTRQWLSDGRRWLTFSPVDGSLECGSRPVPRHEG